MEMDHEVKLLPVKHDDLSFISQSHIKVKRENNHLHGTGPDLHMGANVNR